jgi:hypothetical protein
MHGHRDGPDVGSENQAFRPALILGLLSLAIALRLLRYLQTFPMWCDETMLAANLLDRGWIDLVKPLDYRQVCPLGFLGLEWFAVRRLGFSEASLRLLPLLASIASVPLFHRFARRVCGRASVATVLALGLFAVSEPLIRYAAEVKPYATDLMVSLVLLNIAWEWTRAPQNTRGLWLLAGLAPAAIALSLPSVFILGGIAVIGLREVIVQRSLRLALAYAALIAAAAATVALLAVIGQYQATPADRAYYLNFWAAAFPPPWNHPASLARWLLRTHTGPWFAYPLGGRPGFDWLSASVFVCFVLGIVLWSRRDRRLVSLLVLPFVLTFFAAALRRYPYGMSARIAQYLVPSIMLLSATGAAWICARLRERRLIRLAPRLLLVLMVVVGLWRVGRDLGHPYRTPWDHSAREFARWFWEEVRTEGELVCVQSDLGLCAQSGEWSYDGYDQYLCFQRIYSRRHRDRRPPRWETISEARPLLCVLLNRRPEQVPRFIEWIEAQRDRYTLSDVRTYRASPGSSVEPPQIYVVCKFLPAAAQVSVRTGTSTPPR